MRLIRFRTSVATVAAAVVLVVLVVLTMAAESAGVSAQQQTAPPKAAGIATPLINGIWQLNQSASSTSADLAGAGGQGRSTGGASYGGRGGRGGRGGGRGGGGLSPDQLQKARALVADVTTMPQRLTVILSGADVTFTFDSGPVLHYSTTGKEEKQDFTNGSVKTKTTWDGGVLSIHIDAGDNAKLVETCAVSGDQLVITFARDTAGATASAGGSSDRSSLERRWVYDAVKWS